MEKPHRRDTKQRKQAQKSKYALSLLAGSRKGIITNDNRRQNRGPTWKLMGPGKENKGLFQVTTILFYFIRGAEYGNLRFMNFQPYMYTYT